MSVKPDLNVGQVLAMADGQVIGFVNTKARFDAVSHALMMAGYADSSIIALSGEDGVETFERQQTASDFAIGEDTITELSIKELRSGHYAIGIHATNRAGALQIANLLELLGAHRLSYFAAWVHEPLMH